jgi:hypothetical protein
MGSDFRAGVLRDTDFPTCDSFVRDRCTALTRQPLICTVAPNSFGIGKLGALIFNDITGDLDDWTEPGAICVRYTNS